MTTLTDDSHAALRRSVYCFLILAAAGTMIGRIWSVSADNGQTPFLSANDRSRWCTIRSLVDEGTYAIDDVIINPRTGKVDKRWYTIDMVRLRGHDGKEHYYSSKPPLLPTLLAGEYWLIEQLTGVGLEEHPFYVGRIILITTNVLPLVVLFILLAWLVERYGRTDWGRLFVMVAATFGTFLTTFSVTLNNHVVAAVCVAIALYAAIAIWCEGRRCWYYFVLAGLFSAFAAANELPALSFFVVLAIGLAWKSPLRTLAAFAPAALLVAIGFFATNIVAYDSWRPPYSHRGDGKLLATLDIQLRDDLDNGVVPGELVRRLKALDAAQPIELSSQAIVEPAQPIGGHVAPIWQFWKPYDPVYSRWAVWDSEQERRLAIVEYTSGEKLYVYQWDNWYEYPGSYWLEGSRGGIDVGEASIPVYTFNVLVGHHGLFSLTPIWLLAAVGLFVLLGDEYRKLRCFAVLTLVLSAVCILFYLTRPVEDRNYGGMTCGLRWLIWLIPMWLLALLPIADAVAENRWLRWGSMLLLLLSVVSAGYASLNPWVHPWIYSYWDYIEIYRHFDWLNPAQESAWLRISPPPEFFS